MKVKIKKGEKLKGGAGDNKPDSAFDPKQLKVGIGDETGEHTPNKQVGREIAKDHLSQDPDYYKKLKAAGLEENRETGMFKKSHNSLLKRGWDTSDAEEIGSGYNGIAFKFAGNKVLKVTVDESEARAAAHLKGKTLKHVIAVHDAFIFPAQGDYEKWYGIVEDLAEPLPNKELFGNYIFFVTNKTNLAGGHVDNPWKMDWQQLKKRVLQNCFDDKEDLSFANEAFKFLEDIQFPQLFQELKQNNIVYRDVHEDNFMMKGGTLVLVDLGGQTKSPGAIPPELKEKRIKESQQANKIIAWKNSRWMFLDTETTGLPPDKKNPTRKDPRVVQLGYAVVDNMTVVKVFNDLVDPGADVEIDPSAAAVTGIDRALLSAAGAQDFKTLINKIKADMESCDVIMAYNIRFDKAVLEREFKIAGVEMPKKPWLDPMIWLMKNLPLPNHKLTTVANHYKVSLEHAHDAGADSKAAAEVTMAFMQTFDGLPDDADQVVKLQGVWAQELTAARMEAYRNKQKIKEAAKKQKNFYVLVGPPAVGKSTWIKKNFADKGKDFAVISNDEIIEKVIYPKYGLNASVIWSKDPNKSEHAKAAFIELRKLIADRIAEVVKSGSENIIVDGIGATKNSRKISLNIANALPGYKKIAVVFEFAGQEDKIIARDIQRAKERNGERTAMNPEEIRKAMNKIVTEPPTTAEGFDEVTSYNSFKEPQLNEAKLSSYWKKRAARRAKNASRNWPNGIDRSWALGEQEKSSAINSSIQNIFQKDLDETESMIDDVGKVMLKIKNAREQMKLRRETKQALEHPAKATARRKKGKTLSSPTKPEYGGVVKGFKKKKGAKIAPGESFGPSEE